MAPESFGIVVFRFEGTVPDILGLARPSQIWLELEDFRPDPSKCFTGNYSVICSLSFCFSLDLEVATK
jgi:hypothetical protein